MHYLYLISDGMFVKIGVSTDPLARLAALQTGNPRELTLLDCWEVGTTFREAAKVEAGVHAAFSEHQALNEWYRPIVVELLQNSGVRASLGLEGQTARESTAKVQS